MRILLNIVAFLLLVALPAGAQELEIGTFGYQHDKLHMSYQQLFHVAEDGAVHSHEPERFVQGVAPPPTPNPYTVIFSLGRCQCNVGQCRPANYRVSLASPSGVQMEVGKDNWCDIPKEALLTDKDLKGKKIPGELLVYPAHICADEELDINGCPVTIECGIVFATG